MNKAHFRCSIALWLAGLACYSSILHSNQNEHLSAQQWFDSDLEEQALAVNEGPLDFITAEPAGNILFTRKTLVISPHSLAHGWVRLDQCYYHLDAVDEMTIGYHYQAINHLEITASRNIGEATTSDQNIELRNVGHEAMLCIQAEVLLLESGNGLFRLRSGPYHRKFLDGYYPFHVALEVKYPQDLLKPVSIKPANQPGFRVTEQENTILVDSLFRGKLTIQIIFNLIDKN